MARLGYEGVTSNRIKTKSRYEPAKTGYPSMTHL